MLKIQILKTLAERPTDDLVLSLADLNFEFVSDFDIRISSLLIG
jgi:hypothetical protein